MRVLCKPQRPDSPDIDDFIYESEIEHPSEK